MRTSSSLLSRFETFSRKYAEGVTAFVGLLGLLLAVATLIFLYRDYSLRYRPYVVPGVVAENFKDKPGLLVNIKPTNVGSYPCYVKITNIWLQIGDEKYQTPDMDDWLLLGPQGGVGFAVPAGHVNETGVKNVRESRYARNRIDLCFD